MTAFLPLNRWVSSAGWGWLSSISLHALALTATAWSWTIQRPQDPVALNAPSRPAVTITWVRERSDESRSVGPASPAVQLNRADAVQPGDSAASESSPAVEVEPMNATINRRRYVISSTPNDRPKFDPAVSGSLRKTELERAGERSRPEFSVKPVARPRRRPIQLTRPLTGQPVAATQVGSKTTLPDFGNNPPPVYPASAVRQELEGVVVLRVHVGASGRVASVDLLRSSGHAALDGAAANAVKLWTAAPARRGGKSVSTTVLLPVRFRLR